MRLDDDFEGRCARTLMGEVFEIELRGVLNV